MIRATRSAEDLDEVSKNEFPNYKSTVIIVGYRGLVTNVTSGAKRGHFFYASNLNIDNVE